MPSVVGLLGSGSGTEGSRGVLGGVVAAPGARERGSREERGEGRKEEERGGSAALGWLRRPRLGSAGRWPASEGVLGSERKRERGSSVRVREREKREREPGGERERKMRGRE